MQKQVCVLSFHHCVIYSKHQKRQILQNSLYTKKQPFSIPSRLISVNLEISLRAAVKEISHIGHSEICLFSKKTVKN